VAAIRAGAERQSSSRSAEQKRRWSAAFRAAAGRRSLSHFVGAGPHKPVSVRPRGFEASDMPFLVEMVRLASTLEDRPLPAADDPVVLAVLPLASDSVVVATDDSGTRSGSLGAMSMIHCA